MDRTAETPDTLDPDLADLLSLGEETAAGQQPEGRQPAAGRAAGSAGAEEPSFAALFGEERRKAAAPLEEVETVRRGFEPIRKFEEAPKPLFVDKDFYRTVLSGEGESGQRVHDLVTRYMKATDPEEKSGHRAKLITAWWELAASIGARAGKELPIPKRVLLRFGVLSPTFLSPELRDMLCRLPWENRTGEPVFYLDEWLDRIARGSVRLSQSDEVKEVRRETSQKIVDALEKKRGQRESEITILRGKVAQLGDLEQELREQVEQIMRHEVREDFGGLKAPFDAAQKAAIGAVQETLRRLSSLDGQIASSYSAVEDIDEELEALARRSDGATTESTVDPRAASMEFANLRQMAKMCVGRKGNHFPILLAQYVRPNPKEVATRENVITQMAGVEALDAGLFIRVHKNQPNRIVPNVILVPSYGETGICWEPFEKFNRSTSRGRIAIPMYPAKGLPLAVLTALADLRWQVAKEKAQHYWMEEGITGKYYQWFDEKKLRGDVREYFIRDYLLWITRESQGTQKLDREVRGIFWRLMPFPQQIKDYL
jgi:hypothetical protein